MIQADHPRVLTLFSGIVLGLSQTAWAQRGFHGGGGGDGNQGSVIPIQVMPRPFGGVPAEAPRPISIPTFGHPFPPVPHPSQPIFRPPIATPFSRHDGFANDGHSFQGSMNGFAASGSFHNGPFSLAFTTGGPFFDSHHHFTPCDGSLWPFYPLAGLGYYYGNGSYYSDYYPYGYNYPYPYSGMGNAPATPQAEPQPSMAAPRTPLEHAGDLLAAGDPHGAVTAYQSYLKDHPSDADATRALGLSLIDAGRTADGVAVISMAYRLDSTLSTRPFGLDTLGAARTRRDLNLVSGYANREKTASSWLALASFMQAEGRYRQASMMVDKAKAAGLDPQIAQEMSSSLAGNDVKH